MITPSFANWYLKDSIMCYASYGRAFRVSPTPRIFKFTLSRNKWIFAADYTFYLKCDSVIGDWLRKHEF